MLCRYLKALVGWGSPDVHCRWFRSSAAILWRVGRDETTPCRHVGIVQTFGRTILPDVESRLQGIAALDEVSAQIALRRLTRRQAFGGGIVLFLVGLSVLQFGISAWLTSH